MMPSLAGLFDSAQSALTTLLEFAALISVVVFVHEMGHLLVAKWRGVKAEHFSIGFGPRVFGFNLGETEYRLSALPFGGYVKFAGDNPHEEVAPGDRGRGFLEATPLSRGLIAVAGPAANFVLALVISLGLNLVPHPDLAPVVGFVKPGSPADVGGLQHGDRVLAIDGTPVRGFFELQELVSAVWGRPLALQVKRGAAELALSVTPALLEEDTPLGVQKSGRIGVSSYPRTAVLSVLGPDTPAGRSGLQTFDTITKLGAVEIKSYEQLIDVLEAKLSAPAGPPEVLEVAATRPLPPEPLPAAGTPPAPRPVKGKRAEAPSLVPASVKGSLTLPAPLGRPVKHAEVEALVGLASSDLTIAQVQPGSAADKAGLRRGDRVLEVQGKPVIWWGDEVERARQAAGAAPLAFVVLRDGQKLAVTVTQTMRQERDEAGVRKQVPDLGAFPDRTVLRGEQELITVQYGPAEAVRRAVLDVGEKTHQMALGIARIFSGKLSSEAVGGPLMIADLTRKAADASLLAFFFLMGMFSLNLGLMNLLPVPVLDGFHVLSAMIEAVWRRPLSLQFRETANKVGLAMVLALMLFAFHNDVMRKFFDP